mmetsp:Transcript_38904/g.50303  ORF Transcript_38904/g.50303 Transcript_38904/m.50303 type:complete len:130 (+) Transcript_38904:476-865(+)
MSELKSSMVGMMISISNCVMLLLKSDYSNYISIVLLNPTLFIAPSLVHRHQEEVKDWTGVDPMFALHEHVQQQAEHYISKIDNGIAALHAADPDSPALQDLQDTKQYMQEHIVNVALRYAKVVGCAAWS